MNKKILIVFWGNPFFDGRCMNMINQLLKHNYQISVLGVGNKIEGLKQKNIIIKLINPILLRNPFTKYFKYFKYVKNYIITNKVDVIIASDLYSMIPCAKIKTIQNIKVIYDSRELYTKLGCLKNKPFIQAIWSWYEKKYINQVDCILTNADIDAMYLKELYNHPNIKLIKNLPGNHFLNSQSTNLKNLLCLSDTCQIMVYQGKFHAGRGIRFSIKCISKLNNTVLVLIGEGPMKEAYFEEAKKYNMLDRLFFIDAVPYERLGLLTTKSSIGLSMIAPISTSYKHALPNKLFEYAVSGVPVICSNLSAMEDMVDTYNSGIAINYNKENEFIEAYNTIVNNYNDYVLEKTKRAKLLWNMGNQHLCEIIDE